MTVTFDPSTDFETIVDGLEAVTLVIDGIDDQDIDHAHRNQHRRRESDPAGGDAVASVTTWQWPMAESERPPLGSVIVDEDGTRYTIIDLAEQVLMSKYSADTRALSIEAGLDTYVNLQQATYAKADGGEAVPTWKTILTGLRAKVQLSEHSLEVEHDADETEQRYDVILEKSLPDSIVAVVGADYRVRDAKQNVYRVESYQRPKRIDALPVLVCVKE